jgi:chemotaxis protein methyltransferase CheR
VNVLLTRPDVDELRDAVRDLLGLELDDSRRDGVASAVRERIVRTGTDTAGYLRLLRAREGRAEARILAESLTICETHFLRHTDQFRALAEVAIPELVQSQGERPALRLLSAGCSSGDEAYSLAIVLLESFPSLLETWEVRITGVDVNRAQLERARAGRYTEWSLREVPEELRRRWFHGSRGELALDERVRRMVTFAELNLVEDDPGFWRPSAFDVVYFRNVAIYFSPAAIRATVARIASALAPGGFLFLGHAENLRGISQDFQLRQSHGCFYYQRRSSRLEARGVRASDASRDLAPSIVESASSWMEAIQRSSERIASLAAEPGAAPPARREGRPPSPRHASRGDIAVAMDLVGQDRPGEALEALGASPRGIADDPDAQLLRAALLTSRGRPEEAEGVCWRLLERDDLDPGAHYLLALCREHAGDRAAACEHDRAAAHIDPGFAMPRLHLGLVARRAGDLEAARRELLQAAFLLEREEPGRILLFGDGFRREGLIQLCRAELRACGGTP